MERQRKKRRNTYSGRNSRMAILMLCCVLQLLFVAQVRADGPAIGFTENAVGKSEAAITVKVLSGTDTYAYVLCPGMAADRTAAEVRTAAGEAQTNAGTGASFAGETGKLAFTGLLSGQYYTLYVTPVSGEGAAVYAYTFVTCPEVTVSCKGLAGDAAKVEFRTNYTIPNAPHTAAGYADCRIYYTAVEKGQQISYLDAADFVSKYAANETTGVVGADCLNSFAVTGTEAGTEYDVYFVMATRGKQDSYQGTDRLSGVCQAKLLGTPKTLGVLYLSNSAATLEPVSGRSLVGLNSFTKGGSHPETEVLAVTTAALRSASDEIGISSAVWSKRYESDQEYAVSADTYANFNAEYTLALTIAAPDAYLFGKDLAVNISGDHERWTSNCSVSGDQKTAVLTITFPKTDADVLKGTGSFDTILVPVHTPKEVLVESLPTEVAIQTVHNANTFFLTNGLTVNKVGILWDTTAISSASGEVGEKTLLTGMLQLPKSVSNPENQRVTISICSKPQHTVTFMNQGKVVEVQTRLGGQTLARPAGVAVDTGFDWAQDWIYDANAGQEGAAADWKTWDFKTSLSSEQPDFQSMTLYTNPSYQTVCHIFDTETPGNDVREAVFQGQGFKSTAALPTLKVTVPGGSVTLERPEAVGYTFGGWYTDPAFSKGSEISALPISVTGGTAVKDIYAKWSPKTDTGYTAEYYLKTLEGAKSGKDDISAYEKMTAEEAQRRIGSAVSMQRNGATNDPLPVTPGVNIPGFTFTRYEFAGDNQGKIAADGSSVVRFFYDRNQYALTLQPAGGKITRQGQASTAEDLEVLFYYEDTAELSDYTAAKKGYSFVKWNGGGTYGKNGTVSIIANVTLKAEYALDTYSISYYWNGEQVTMGTGYSRSYSVTDPFVEEKLPEKPGYEFDGWYLYTGASGDVSEICKYAEDGTHKKLGKGKTIDLTDATGNKVFYARWNALDVDCRINYYLQNTEGVYTDNIFHTEECRLKTGVHSLKDPMDPLVQTIEKDLAGLNADRTTEKLLEKNADGTEKYFQVDPERTTEVVEMPTEGKTVISVYLKRKVYTLSWILPGQNAPVLRYRVCYGASYEMPDSNTTELQGYEIRRWLGQDGTPVSWTARQTMPAGDVTYEADYAAKEYRIAYYSKDAEGAEIACVYEDGKNNPDRFTVETGGIILESPVDTAEWKFAGWYHDAEMTDPVTGTAVEKGTIGQEDEAAGAQTFYAKWLSRKAVSEAEKVEQAVGKIGTVTLERRSYIEGAREACNAFLEQFGKGKTVVSNNGEKAETLIAQADAEIALAESEYTNLEAEHVLGLIRQLPEPSLLTLADQNLVKAAQSAYEDAWTAVEQSVQADAVYEKLTKAIQVMEVLTAAQPEAQKVEQAIRAIGSVQPGSAETLAAIRTAYNSLSESAKAMVSNEVELKKAEETLAALQKGIGKVEALITALPNPDQIVYDLDEDRTAAIQTARSALSSLTKEQQAVVSSELSGKLARLEELDRKINDAADAADLAVLQVKRIGIVYYPNEKMEKRLNQAKGAYYALTDEQKSFLNEERQKAIETAGKALADAEAEFGKQKEDAGCAEAAAEKIRAVVRVALDGEDALLYQDALQAYNRLNEEQKQRLGEEEAAAIQGYMEEYSVLEEAAALQAEADEVVKKIQAIGEIVVTEECNYRIKLARDVYDSLSEEAQKLVGEEQLAALTEAEKTFTEKQTDAANEAAAAEVIKMIQAIGTVTFTDEVEDRITDAREEYNTLTDAQKEKVKDNYTTLTTAETVFAGFQDDKKKAEAVEDLLSAASDLEDPDEMQAALEDVKKAYQALAAEQKAMVNTDFSDDLQSLQDTIDEMKEEAEEEERQEAAEQAEKEKRSVATVEKQITAIKSDKKDTPYAQFYTLSLQASGKKKAVRLNWNPVYEADGYIIYGASKGKKLTRIGKTSQTAYTHKNRKNGTYYKYVVVAYSNDEGKTVLCTSQTVFATPSGSRQGNPTGLTVKNSKKAEITSVALAEGNKCKLKVSQSSDKKVKKCASSAYRYVSSDPTIATVSASGVIKGKNAGTCDVYVFTQNGINRRIAVKVK